VANTILVESTKKKKKYDLKYISQVFFRSGTGNFGRSFWWSANDFYTGKIGSEKYGKQKSVDFSKIG